MARPFEKLPPGSKTHLEAMAANGLLSESAAATALGMPLNELRRVIVDHSPSKKIWENALAVERDQLLQALYSRAIEGDSKAAQHLLSIRHGMSEKTPDRASDRVQINLQLPPALDPAQYEKLVKQQVAKLSSDD